MLKAHIYFKTNRHQWRFRIYAVVGDLSLYVTIRPVVNLSKTLVFEMFLLWWYKKLCILLRLSNKSIQLLKHTTIFPEFTHTHKTHNYFDNIIKNKCKDMKHNVIHAVKTAKERWTRHLVNMVNKINMSSKNPGMQ